MTDSTAPVDEPGSDKQRAEHPHAIPPDSLFFDKIVPALLVILAVLTGIFVLVAIGILTGIIPWL